MGNTYRGLWSGSTGGTEDVEIINAWDGATGATCSIPDSLQEAAERRGISQSVQLTYYRLWWLPV